MIKLENIPAVKVAILMIIGIVAGYYINTGYTLLIAVVIFLFAVLFSFLNFKNNKYPVYALYFLIILAGFFKINYDNFLKPPGSISFTEDTDRDRDVNVTGIVTEPPEYTTDRIRFVLSAEYFEQEDVTRTVSGKILVYLNPDMKIDSGKPIPALNAGDEVSVYGKLRTAPGERNPGEFNYDRYLKLNGIEKIFYSKGYENVEVISSDNLNFFFQYLVYPSRIYALNIIDSQIPGDEGSYLKGLLTGSKTTMSQELKDNFVKAGVMHLIAVSGLNVAYVILFSMMFFSIFRLKREYRFIITIIFIVYYCLFTGAQPSIVRATILGVLVIYAVLIQRRIVFLNLIGASAIVVFMIDSRQLFDAGFILSYSATISMVLFFRKYNEKLQAVILKKRKAVLKIFYYFVILFVSTFAAQLGTLPLTSVYFGKISLISFLSNIFAVPLSNFSLALGMLQVITAPLFGVISEVIAEVNYLLLKLQILMINYFGEIDYAYTVKFNFDSISMIAYFIVLIILYSASKEKYFFKITVAVLIIIAVSVFKYDSGSDMRIIFFDVGQGDASLIVTPSGKTVLIDAGSSNERFDNAKRHIAPYLERNRMSQIDLLILTHHHNDHAGGAEYILKNFDVKKIIFNDVDKYTGNLKSLEDVIISKKIERENLSAGDVINVGEDVKFYCLSPTDLNRSDEENSVIVLKMKFRELDVLFPSDADAVAEMKIANAYNGLLNSDILKVSHHGSKSSTAPAFISSVNPKFAVISCGYENHFNHPAPVTVEKLKAAGCSLCRTDLEGAVVFESDGYKLERVNW